MNESVLNNLVRHINEFDCYYEMSDSNSVYVNNKKIEVGINNQLKKLSIEEKNYVLNNLNNNGKECFKRYFYDS